MLLRTGAVVVAEVTGAVVVAEVTGAVLVAAEVTVAASVAAISVAAIRGFGVVPGWGYGLYDYGCSYGYPNYYGYSCDTPPAY
jgi:hypothetical protein